MTIQPHSSTPIEPVITHFAPAGSRELLFDLAHRCPAYPGLTFDGLAVAGDSQTPSKNEHHLIATLRPPGTKPPTRFYLGPDPAMVARRGLIIVAALQTHGYPYSEPDFGVGVLFWFAACWTEAIGEIAP